jgi:hypothetical protein
MAINLSKKKNTEMAMNIARGIISTPPFTRMENIDSVPVLAELSVVVPNCNKIANIVFCF